MQRATLAVTILLSLLKIIGKMCALTSAAFKTLARKFLPQVHEQQLSAPGDQSKGRVVILADSAPEATVMLAKPSRLSFASPVLSTCGAPGSLLELFGT